MSTNKQTEPKKGFQEVFYSHLDDLELRAHKLGLTMTDLCSRSGVARATPDRWRKSLPSTVRCMIDLEKVVIDAEADEARKKAKG